MKFVIIKTVALSILTLMLVSLAQGAIALPISSNQDKALAIMSNVFSLDLSKYDVVLNGTDSHFDSTFGTNVNQESMLYTLISGDSTVSVDLNFVGDSFWYCNLQTEGKPIYTQTESANVLDQSKSVLQRYQAYVAEYTGSSTLYISSMASMLNGISELKSTSVIANDTKLDISVTTTRFSNIPMQTLKWFYTENGIDVTRKAVTLTYTDGVLTSISDTWNLYSIGSINSISKEEVLNIAWSEAQKLTLQFISDNGSTYYVKPDLSNVTTEVSFSMQPRNNTGLYPSWIVTYYFAKPYHQDYGIEVGIWGDTKQVVFCKPLVILGGSDPSSTSTSPSQTIPNDGLPTTPNDGSGSGSDSSSTLTSPSSGGSSPVNPFLIFTAGTSLIVAMVAIGIVIKKRRNKR